MLKDLPPGWVRLGATLLAILCFVLAAVFSANGVVAAALLGAGTTSLAAAHVRRPGDAAGPTGNVDGLAGGE